MIAKNQELSYYQSDQDQKPSGLPLPLEQALVSNLTVISERPHSFSLQIFSTSHALIRAVFFSANTEKEASEWRDSIIEATKNVGKTAKSRFNQKDMVPSFLENTKEAAP